MTPYMGRLVSTVCAIAAGALALAGCGAQGAPTNAGRLAVPAVDAGPAAVEPTAGRLGDATSVRAGGPLRELSLGGRMDLRRRGVAPRRDGVGAGAACPSPDAVPAPESLSAIAEATLCLLNGERADRGLAPLRPNEKLAVAATAYAEDLVAGSYFSHTARDGSGVVERIERSGYVPRDAAWVLGENLAWGTGGLATPGSIMQAWMNSPGHRDNILNPRYREIGIGVVAGNPAAADGLGATYATEFGALETVDEPEPLAAAPLRRSSERATKLRKRSRHAKARNARRLQRHRRARKAGARRRGRVGHVTARITV
jgi:uncharacterized protein YkwD